MRINVQILSSPLTCVVVILLMVHLASSQMAPEQIHLSLGGSPDEMMVSWVTQTRPEGESLVSYWPSGDGDDDGQKQKLKESGSWKEFNSGFLFLKRHIYIHRVLLKNLTTGIGYHYQVGNGVLMSKVLTMRTLRQDPKYVPKIAIYGDLGKENGQSLPRLINQVDKKNIDIILHIGDMAYDLNDNQGRNGDEFMRKIEPLASRIAYQTIPGNHEQSWNFSHYDNLFANVDQKSRQVNNFFYTTTIGPVRLIAITTEFYYYLIYGTSQMGVQYRWLEHELKEANRRENRQTHPWVVVVSHRPMYCSSRGLLNAHCSLEYLMVRSGWAGNYGLDKLFMEHRVDVYFAGHSHSYERMYPVYGGYGNASKLSHPYDNPWAPVHIVTGSAGCKEQLHKFSGTPPDWSAVRIADYGYAMMYPLNQTNLLIEQISDSKSGKIIDRVMITKSTL